MSVADAVGLITLNRPPMNVLNRAMQDQIAQACEQLVSDDRVRAIVLFGGEHLAAGADVKEMAQWSQEDARREAPHLQKAFNALASIPIPTIAAMSGYALGGGLELALACDLRIAGESCSMGQPEILLGIITGAGGTQRLSRLIGPARAKDLLFTGRIIKASEALAMGLVNEVVADGEVCDRALQLAAVLATRPRLALRAVKTAVDEGLNTDLDSGLKIELELFTQLFGTRDQQVGMTSFLEQGPGKAVYE